MALISPGCPFEREVHDALLPLQYPGSLVDLLPPCRPCETAATPEGVEVLALNRMVVHCARADASGAVIAQIATRHIAPIGHEKQIRRRKPINGNVPQGARRSSREFSALSTAPAAGGEEGRAEERKEGPGRGDADPEEGFGSPRGCEGSGPADVVLAVVELDGVG